MAVPASIADILNVLVIIGGFSQKADANRSLQVDEQGQVVEMLPVLMPEAVRGVAWAEELWKQLDAKL